MSIACTEGGASSPIGNEDGWSWLSSKEVNWAEVQPGVEVKLVAHPDVEGTEQDVICRRPDWQVAQLLTRLGLELPGVPKRIENVVEKIGR